MRRNYKDPSQMSSKELYHYYSATGPGQIDDTSNFTPEDIDALSKNKTVQAAAKGAISSAAGGLVAGTFFGNPAVGAASGAIGGAVSGAVSHHLKPKK